MIRKNYVRGLSFLIQFWQSAQRGGAASAAAYDMQLVGEEEL